MENKVPIVPNMALCKAFRQQILRKVAETCILLKSETIATRFSAQALPPRVIVTWTQ